MAHQIEIVPRQGFQTLPEISRPVQAPEGFLKTPVLAGRDKGCEELVLAFEIRVELSFGHTRSLSNRLHAGAVKPLSQKDNASPFQNLDPLLCRSSRHLHCLPHNSIRSRSKLPMMSVRMDGVGRSKNLRSISGRRVRTMPVKMRDIELQHRVLASNARIFSSTRSAKTLFGLTARSSLTASLICSNSRSEIITLICLLCSWSDGMPDPSMSAAKLAQASCRT
jgi:hypothetical protein